MSLSRKIAAAVDDQIARGGGPAPLVVEDGDHRLTLDVQLASAVGVSCASVELAGGDGPARSLDELKQRGSRIANRLTYLMEPFAIHEADDATGAVRLRSQSPTVRSGRRGFYELTLTRDGRARLARWHFDETSRRREPAACQFTREVLERLVDDLAASFD